LELSLFPFLCPHGHDAYDGKTSIHEYLKFRMSTLFSPFTMYKPYLLIMYDLRQTIQLIKETLNTCFKKDLKNIKQKISHMTNTHIFQHIIKHNFVLGSCLWVGLGISN
jgi:hypothetical protein